MRLEKRLKALAKENDEQASMAQGEHVLTRVSLTFKSQLTTSSRHSRSLLQPSGILSTEESESSLVVAVADEASPSPMVFIGDESNSSSMARKRRVAGTSLALTDAGESG